MVKVEVVCKAESFALVGTLTVPPDKDLTGADIQSGWEADPGFPESAGIVLPTEDGQVALCPRCSEPLHIRCAGEVEQPVRAETVEIAVGVTAQIGAHTRHVGTTVPLIAGALRVSA